MFPVPSQPGPALVSQLYLPLFFYIRTTLNSCTCLGTFTFPSSLLQQMIHYLPPNGKHAEPSSPLPPFLSILQGQFKKDTWSISAPAVLLLEIICLLIPFVTLLLLGLDTFCVWPLTRRQHPRLILFPIPTPLHSTSVGLSRKVRCHDLQGWSKSQHSGQRQQHPHQSHCDFPWPRRALRMRNTVLPTALLNGVR